MVREQIIKSLKPEIIIIGETQLEGETKLFILMGMNPLYIT